MIVVWPKRVKLAVSKHWLERAAQVLTDLESAASDVERKKIIKDKSNLWGELKATLFEISHGKCWYCETKNLRADNAVDHYRPKGSPKEATDHPGYWWLAFDYTNFRAACTFCNSRRHGKDKETVGGKQEHFPVPDETTRAKSNADSLDDENATLIDPCVSLDVDLVWFDDEGKTQLNPSAAEHTTDAEFRLKSSREIYHLDEPELVDARRLVYVDVQDLCDKADKMLTQLAAGGTAAKTAYEQSAERISELISEHAQHARAARCALAGYRGKSKTAEMFYGSW